MSTRLHLHRELHKKDEHDPYYQFETRHHDMDFFMARVRIAEWIAIALFLVVATWILV